MEVPGKIWLLMSRCLSGEANSEEYAELQIHLLQNPELQNQYQALKSLWPARQREASGSDVSGNLKRIFQRADEERKLPAVKIKKPAILAFAWKYGIAAMLLLSLYLFYFDQPERSSESSLTSEQVITAQPGSRTRALLPDGSTVWLNGGSKLTFQANFDGSSREVILEGEAFFDVVKMASKPFVVHLGAMDIKVLGTAFNVKNYKDDKLIEATLLRGAIEVIPGHGLAQEHIFLKPNQKLVFSKDKRQKVAPKSNVETIIVQGPVYQLEEIPGNLNESEREETAWIYNRVEFRGENFEELAGKLERWYNIKITFLDDQVKQLKFNGSFEKETVTQAFDALQKVASFEYKLNGREIFIKSSE